MLSGIVCINYIFIVVLAYHECVPFFCFVNFKNCFLLYLLKTSLLVRFALFLISNSEFWCVESVVVTAINVQLFTDFVNRM